LNQKQAYDHFCIYENSQLALLESIIGKGRWSKIILTLILAKYEKWLKRDGRGKPGAGSNFLKGNGSKIHKYIFKLIHEAGGKIPEDDLLWLVKHDPGMRSTALRYLGHSTKNNTNLATIEKIVIGCHLVDDSSLVDITGYLLHAKFKTTSKCLRSIRSICSEFCARGDIGIHCAIFISSRFLFRAEILRMLQHHRNSIKDDYWLARAAAGILPRFFGHSDHLGIYMDFVRGLHNEDAERVLNYLFSVHQDTTVSNSLKSYLEAQGNRFWN